MTYKVEFSVQINAGSGRDPGRRGPASGQAGRPRENHVPSRAGASFARARSARQEQQPADRPRVVHGTAQIARHDAQDLLGL